jgi:putative photosynthetic complex assembly protein
MSSHSHDIALPRLPLAAAMLLLVGTVLAVTLWRVAGHEPDSAPSAAAVAERELRFEDRPDGRIVAIDVNGAAGDSTAVIVVAEPGEQGFLRGALRALARERRGHGLGAEAPFRLVAHADGRLSLQDTATGRRVDLESFGPTNAAVFARLLPPPQR